MMTFLSFPLEGAKGDWLLRPQYIEKGFDMVFLQRNKRTNEQMNK
jgi:hypothetical protein